MAKYKVTLSTRARIQLLNHISFLAKVSLSAARRLRNSFENIRRRLSDNPFQFPLDPLSSKLDLRYRCAFFEGRYKVLFIVEANEVFIDSVTDCRQQRDSVSVNR